MQALQDVSKPFMTVALNTGYYVVDCTAKLFKDTDSISNIARLATVSLRIASEEAGRRITPEFYDVCEKVIEWTSATKLPSRTAGLVNGDCVKTNFLGYINVPKVLSCIALIANDALNVVKDLVHWGIIAKEVGKHLTFNVKESVLKQFSHTAAISAWGLDLSDALAQLYENGPSLKCWLTILGDSAKLTSLLTQSSPTGILGAIHMGANFFSPIFSIAKTIVKEYDIRIPRHWYA